MLDASVMVRQFIIENFLFEESGILKEDTSFLENGIIDSTGVLELVSFLEENSE
jgi:acyl carrier protein